jgi:hypothetical protein
VSSLIDIGIQTLLHFKRHMQLNISELKDWVKTLVPVVTTCFVILQFRLNRRNAINQVYQERKSVYQCCYRVARSVVDDFADPCDQKIIDEIERFFEMNPGYTQLFDTDTCRYIAGIISSAGQYAIIMKRKRGGETVDAETNRAPVGIRTYMMEQIARNQGQMSALDKVFLEAVNTFPPQTSKQDKSSNRFIKKFAPTAPWGK